MPSRRMIPGRSRRTGRERLDMKPHETGDQREPGDEHKETVRIEREPDRPAIARGLATLEGNERADHSGHGRDCEPYEEPETDFRRGPEESRGERSQDRHGPGYPGEIRPPAVIGGHLRYNGTQAFLLRVYPVSVSVVVSGPFWSLNNKPNASA